MYSAIHSEILRWQQTKDFQLFPSKVPFPPLHPSKYPLYPCYHQSTLFTLFGYSPARHPPSQDPSK